jgi:hypothetical protein
MDRLARFVFLGMLAIGAVAQSELHPNRTQIDKEHTAWIADVLNAAHTVKVGMTRADVMKVFTTEGGLSTTSQRTYVYRQCPYVKVDVRFAAASRDKELPTDEIIGVSRPYLAWSVMD